MPRAPSSWASLAIGAAVAVAAACGPSQNGPIDPTAGEPGGTSVVVHRVVDGDTIIVGEGPDDVRVRLIGVDSPESVKPGSPVQCFAIKASDFTKGALTDRPVRLEYDIDRFDRYGRTLAYVWVGSTMFNEA